MLAYYFTDALISLEINLTRDELTYGVWKDDEGKEIPLGDILGMTLPCSYDECYEATRAIRQLPDPETAGIPIIAMTANAFDEDKQNAFAAGMNGHIAKPINVGILKETMASFLSKPKNQ